MDEHKCKFKLEIVNRPCLHFLCRGCGNHICIERDELYSAIVGLRRQIITFLPMNVNRM